jgi:RNA recognition motif-containing protein
MNDLKNSSQISEDKETVNKDFLNFIMNKKNKVNKIGNKPSNKKSNGKDKIKPNTDLDNNLVDFDDLEESNDKKTKFIYLDNNFVPQKAPEINNSQNDGSLKALLNKFAGSVVNKIANVAEQEDEKNDSDENESESSHTDEESQLSEEDYQDSNYNHFISFKNEEEVVSDLEDEEDETSKKQQMKNNKKERRKVECEVFAENIPLDKNEKEIIKILKKGNTNIVKIKVLKDKETGKSKGKAFIKFFSAEDANLLLNSKLKIEKNKIVFSLVKKFEQNEENEKDFKKNDNSKNKVNKSKPNKFSHTQNSEKNTLHTAFIRNLPLILEEETVKKTFKKYGKIANIRLMKTKEGKSKGFGYIDFETETDLEKVLKNDQVITLGGKEIHIEKAKSSFSDIVYETGKRLGKKKKREKSETQEEEN